ncbi:MAG: integrase core domain-containing protein [Rubritalea sp.]|uniref:integrase core domain-containing protein n=1 Tax=Rubritalea sp. TaxID=2109375 RepID=UPI003241F44F
MRKSSSGATSNVAELEALVDDWMEFYNHRRMHQSLSKQTPWSVYQEAQRQAT